MHDLAVSGLRAAWVDSDGSRVEGPDDTCTAVSFRVFIDADLKRIGASPQTWEFMVQRRLSEPLARRAAETT